MAERDQPYDPTAGLTPEEWVEGIQEFLVGLAAAQQQSQGTSAREDLGRGVVANTLGLVVPPLRERAMAGMSPVGKVLGEVLNPATLPLGGAEVAGLSAFLPTIKRERVEALAARAADRFPDITPATAEKLATEQAIGEAAQRYRIGMKRAKGDEGLYDAVGTMGIFTGKRGAAGAHPFQETDPLTNQRNLGALTDQMFSEVVDAMTGKAGGGLPTVMRPPLTRLTPSDAGYLLERAASRATTPPTTSEVMNPIMSALGGHAVQPDAHIPVMSMERRREILPVGIYVEDIPAVIEAIVKASGGSR